jgi:hypothetical protein
MTPNNTLGSDCALPTLPTQIFVVNSDSMTEIQFNEFKEKLHKELGFEVPVILLRETESLYTIKL